MPVDGQKQCRVQRAVESDAFLAGALRERLYDFFRNLNGESVSARRFFVNGRSPFAAGLHAIGDLVPHLCKDIAHSAESHAPSFERGGETGFKHRRRRKLGN